MWTDEEEDEDEDANQDDEAVESGAREVLAPISRRAPIPPKRLNHCSVTVCGALPAGAEKLNSTSSCQPNGQSNRRRRTHSLSPNGAG